MSHRLTVTAGAAGTRLDVFLATELAVSRSQIQRWLRANAITVNSHPARANYLISAGDTIAVTLVATPSSPLTPPNLPIIYKDDDVLVIDKPAGLMTHPGAGRHAEATVADFARQYTTDPDPERPGIVHRLDRETSGLLVIARTPTAKTFLQQQWRTHQVHKTYQLLAVGRVEPAEAVINLPLDRDPARPLRRHVAAHGRPAITRYRTLAGYPGYTLIEAYPETGRTHQLRVHFAALGHPIVGDRVYGSAHTTLGLHRHFLHATVLTFPVSQGKTLSFTSPLPPELQAILSRLEGPYN